MTGITGRKLSYRTATLRLIRNDIREIFIEITPEKLKPIKLKLKDFTIHKKFMNEGKASINFNQEKCVLFISNAPPATLIIFLKIIFIKMNSENEEDEKLLQKKLRAHLLSGRPTKFENISPVTNLEIKKARKSTVKSSTETSSSSSSLHAKKRKFDEINSNNDINNIDDKKNKTPTAKKKLYDESTSPTLSQSSSLNGDGSVDTYEENLQLNDEQNQILQACLSGKNIFFTGSAGTGKSFLLRKIISVLPPEGTVVTASTGVAACLIGGVTLHSFAGIGSGEATLQRCYEMASRPTNAQIWRRCKRLIVDEISMIDSKYFDKIESVARYIRKNDKPFGGIQLILCGDFFQLPPIIKKDGGQNNMNNNDKRFCFQSIAWEKCIQHVYELNQVHRQNDPEFIKILNHIRIGYVNDDIIKRLQQTAIQNIEINGILATQLCSHTQDANQINSTKLQNLNGELKIFKAEDSDKNITKQLEQQIQVPTELQLKINAQVMLLKNINIANGLVNGARGIIVKYVNNLPLVKFKNNIEYLCKPEKWIIKQANGHIITRKQIPLKLAWAFSIHKSQGLTLDCVEMSLSKVFEAGQAYVALSRAKSLDSIRVLDFDSKQVWANPYVLQYYKIIRRRIHDMTLIPLGHNKSLNSNSNNGNNNGANNKNNGKLIKLKKSVMEKPLVNIC